jgi:hypothetical protein
MKALPPEDHNGWGIGYIVEYRRRPPPGEELTSNIKWNKVCLYILHIYIYLIFDSHF